MLDDLEGVRVATLSNDTGVWLSMPRVMEVALVGSSSEAAWRLERAEDEHMRLVRVGAHVYLEATGPTRVNGELAERRRLRGGETVSILDLELRFAFVDAVDEVPTASGQVVAPPEDIGEDDTTLDRDAEDAAAASLQSARHGFSEDEGDTVIAAPPALKRPDESPSKQHADTILSAMKRSAPPVDDRASAPEPQQAKSVEEAAAEAPPVEPSTDEGAQASLTEATSEPESEAPEAEAMASEPTEPTLQPIPPEEPATEPEARLAEQEAQPAESDGEPIASADEGMGLEGDNGLSLGSTDDLFSPPALLDEVPAPVQATEEEVAPAVAEVEPEPEASAESAPQEAQPTDPPASPLEGASSHTLVPPQSLFMPINLEAPESSSPPPSPDPVEAQTRALVEFMSGPSRGTTTEIETAITIGSGAVDIQITGDPRIEAEHCTISRRGPDAFVVVDGGSAVGTFVNGAPVTTTPLIGGEVIMVGRTVLRFRLMD